MPYLLFKAHVLFSEISMVSWCERRISRSPAAEPHRKRVGLDRRPAAAPLRQRPRIVPQQRHRQHGRLWTEGVFRDGTCLARAGQGQILSRKAVRPPYLGELVEEILLRRPRLLPRGFCARTPAQLTARLGQA